MGGKRQGAGRPKGSKNKVTTALREAILEAATNHGRDGNGKNGLVGYLAKVAEEDIKAFSGLLGKVLPLQLTGDEDAPVQQTLIVKYVDANHSDPKRLQ